MAWSKTCAHDHPVPLRVALPLALRAGAMPDTAANRQRQEARAENTIEALDAMNEMLYTMGVDRDLIVREQQGLYAPTYTNHVGDVLQGSLMVSRHGRARVIYSYGMPQPPPYRGASRVVTNHLPHPTLTLTLSLSGVRISPRGRWSGWAA